MARKTEFKPVQSMSFRETMAQGFRTLGGSDVPNYSLVYLNPTKSKRAGEFDTIVIPYIEIGRASNCVVQYDDTYSSVSRKHAAIFWENGEIYVKHIGKNPTMVNGQQVMDRIQLKNGDEIQFSFDGPKIRFNATATKTSTLKITQRMAMFAQQALKPYKTAIYVLSGLLFAAILGGAYLNYQNKLEIESLNADLSKKTTELISISQQQKDAELKMADLIAEGKENSDEYQQLSAANSRLVSVTRSLQSQINNTKEKLGNNYVPQAPPSVSVNNNSSQTSAMQSKTTESNNSEEPTVGKRDEITTDVEDRNIKNTKPLSDILKQVIKNNIYIVRQEYKLRDRNGVESTKEGKAYYGYNYGLGVACDNRLWTLSDVLSPWNADREYEQVKSDYEPYRSSQYIRKVNDKLFRNVDNESTVYYDEVQEIGTYKLNSIPSYMASTKEKDATRGTLIIFYVDQGSDIEKATIKTLAYNVDPNWDGVYGYIEKSLETRKKLLGGVYFREEVQEGAVAGGIQCKVVGLYDEKDGRPRVISIADMNPASKPVTKNSKNSRRGSRSESSNSSSSSSSSSGSGTRTGKR